jgi:hypothetical protein
MAYIDTQKSLITQLYTYLTADAALKSAMGGTVRCYFTWAKADAELPYLVHRLDVRSTDFWPIREATYTLDIWSASDSADEITAIRKAVIEELDHLTFSTTEADTCRIRLLSDGFIPEPEEGIFHISMLFNIRFYRKGEVAAIINR